MDVCGSHRDERKAWEYERLRDRRDWDWIEVLLDGIIGRGGARRLVSIDGLRHGAG